MKFTEALKKAGLRNPGQRTWHGKATDGTAVFTIWSHDIRQINGRAFAWWDHNNAKPESEAALRPATRASQKAFVKRAADNIGRNCRAVIIHRKPGKTWHVGSADYPHPTMARAVFRTADTDALQFIVELLPGA